MYRESNWPGIFRIWPKCCVKEQTLKISPLLASNLRSTARPVPFLLSPQRVERGIPKALTPWMVRSAIHSLDRYAESSQASG